ncbi:hypothetical protein BFW38_15510 [Terasakiispira papahanaumokuakeensis]|uniref:TonB C-terminal domain-containing protein n=1 Tax=Terasakiispira papahanaumokuakeensis TaxID=197479 RepID=A0A1E2VCL1_9GAMM|nr:energy transducer TonB [Terasakiispira papahanaumokuakeensis]ODC04727.1 hypothetical protein BFW38_15510 [Terasakiispira papahanaumokuakeensis]
MTGQGAATGRWVVAITLAVLCHVPLLWWSWPEPEVPRITPPIEVSLTSVGTADRQHPSESVAETTDATAETETAPEAVASSEPLHKASPAKAPTHKETPHKDAPPATPSSIPPATSPAAPEASDTVGAEGSLTPKLDEPHQVNRPHASAGQLLQQSFDLAEQPVAQNAQPRVRHLSSSTDEQDAEARVYLSQWRRRVEQTGNLNYPEEARRRQLTGGLRLSVVLNLDGTLKQVQVVRSSGYPLLDEAAVRIVRLAAPFPAPPSVLTEGVDALEITRNWQFGKRWQAQ